MLAAAAADGVFSEGANYCGACLRLASDQAIVCLDCVVSSSSSAAADACNGDTSEPLQRAPITNSVSSAEAELAGEQARAEQG